MPYTTGAQWTPVINDVTDRLNYCRQLISAVDLHKMSPKIELPVNTFDDDMTNAKLNAIKQEFLAQATAARDALNVALA